MTPACVRCPSTMSSSKVSLATPPFGLPLFVMKGASLETPMRDIITSTLPFVGLALLVVVLLVAVPQTTLVLPGLMSR